MVKLLPLLLPTFLHSVNAVHCYTVDWDVLSKGGEGVTAQIDSDGDGKFEKTVNTGAIFAEYPYDVNLDGVVDTSDLEIVGKHFGESPTTEPRADVNKDGKVDILDIALIGRHFGEKYQESIFVPK